jgi:hypothetical protein
MPWTKKSSTKETTGTFSSPSARIRLATCEQRWKVETMSAGCSAATRWRRRRRAKTARDADAAARWSWPGRIANWKVSPVQPGRPHGHELVEARQASAEADREQPSHVDQLRAHPLAGEARRKLTAHLVMAGAHACRHDDDEGPVLHVGTGAAGHCPSRPWGWAARASSSNWSRVDNAFIPPGRQLIGRA